MVQLTDADAIKVMQGLAVVFPFLELRPNRLQKEQVATFTLWFKEYMRLKAAGAPVERSLLGALAIEPPCARWSDKWPWRYLNKVWC